MLLHLVIFCALGGHTSHILPAFWLRPGTWLDIQQQGQPLKKMARGEYLRNFEEEIAPLIKDESVFKPSTASLQEYRSIAKGRGDLDEGIWTHMKIGDLNVVGDPDEAPPENLVLQDYYYRYQGKELKIPLTALLPVLTVIGTEETKPGGWKLLYECDRSQLWAFLKCLVKMKQGGDMGLEACEQRYLKIKTDLLENVPVVIVKMQEEDELWADWHRSNQAGHTDVQHSVERLSNRYRFFGKLHLTLKKKTKDEGNPAEVSVKNLFEAYTSAEQEHKFRTAKGMTGVRNESALSSVMKWGHFITKIGLMPLWISLELLEEGKTPFYSTAFGSSFCTCIENNEEIAKYVLHALKKMMEDEKWRKKMTDSTPMKMKSIVRSLVLQFKWAKYVTVRSFALGEGSGWDLSWPVRVHPQVVVSGNLEPRNLGNWRSRDLEN